MRMLKAVYRSRGGLGVRRWLAQVADPVWGIKGLLGYPRYFADWWRYARMSGAEPARPIDAYPQVHDRTSTTPFDRQYVYTNGWAMRRIVETHPSYHVDVGSQITFVSLLAAVVPLVFVEYRPPHIILDGLYTVGGDVRSLPFADASIPSLSCLHVIEHIGLGRYGDPFDVHGTSKAAQELARVLAPGGNLLLAVPVGRPRLCFNAHRIHSPEAIPGLFPSFDLVEFSGIGDDGQYVERAQLAQFRESECACGFYWFRKPE